MKLSTQMVIVSALTLAVPLIGWQSVAQLYESLQQTRIEEQTHKAINLRASLAEQTEVQRLLAERLQHADEPLWFAESMPFPLFVDGYQDDWRTLIGLPVEHVGEAGRVSIRVARRDQRLFLFLRVADDQLVWHRPPAPIVDPAEGEQTDAALLLSAGDAVELLFESPDQSRRHVLIRAIAPGDLQPLVASDGEAGQGPFSRAGQVLAGWQGAWVVSEEGYQVELELPLPAQGTRVAFTVVDVDAEIDADVTEDRPTGWFGSMSPDWMRRVHAGGSWPDEFRGARLHYSIWQIAARLRPWVTPGSRVRLFAADGSLLADVNALYDQVKPPEPSLWDTLLYRLFAWFVAGDLPLFSEEHKNREPLHLNADRQRKAAQEGLATTRYVTVDNDRVLGTLAPLRDTANTVRAYLLFESNEEHASAYSSSRLARLFSLLLLVSLLAGSALLIYAVTLSFRVRRLSRQARLALGGDGRVKALPISHARDEIGDLSRDLSSLLSRSAAYTDYLEALSSRLSHELRTPLSVVRTSLEHIDRDALDPSSRTFFDRANEGTRQLSSIIRALVESTRLEQIVQGARRSNVDLDYFARNALSRYQQIYPHTAITLAAGVRSDIIAAPELLEQALDKLVDNAVDFADDDRLDIIVTLETLQARRHVCIAVRNRGRLETRDEAADPAHLGLGLAIVGMVAEAHGGSAFIDELPGEILVGMRFPVGRRATA